MCSCMYMYMGPWGGGWWGGEPGSWDMRAGCVGVKLSLTTVMFFHWGRSVTGLHGLWLIHSPLMSYLENKLTSTCDYWTGLRILPEEYLVQCTFQLFLHRFLLWVCCLGFLFSFNFPLQHLGKGENPAWYCLTIPLGVGICNFVLLFLNWKSKRSSEVKCCRR